MILYSGDEEQFERHRATLASLAGSQRYVGPGDSDATAAYIAIWVYYYGGLGGFFEAAFAASAGIALTDLRALTGTMTSQLLDGIDDAATRVEAGNFTGDQATVDSHIDGLAPSSA